MRYWTTMTRWLLVVLALVPAASAAPMKPRRPTEPTVSIGKPTVTGPLDREIVHRVLKRHQYKFLYCYEKGIAVNDTLAGKLRAAWEILPSGKVANAGTMGIEGATAACTKQVLERIQYPKPRDGSSVAVNVVFTLRR